ncbi:MAG: uroporphyrinogen-III synthase, partial [Ramlibacter sp.]
RQFAGSAPELGWPRATQAWATGPGTAQALREAGVPDAQIVAPADDAVRFDSEALWERAAAAVQPGWRVLVVRGAGADGAPAGRDWLTVRLQAAGAAVDQVAAYARRLPHWSDSQRAAAEQAAVDGSVWLFSSSEAVGNLRRLLPAQDWSRARALATHERIAQAAREAGFVVACVRPGLDALVRALESPR